MFATDPGSDGPGIKTKVIQFADAAGSLLELFQDSTRLDPSQSLLSKTSHHLLHDLTSTLLLQGDVFSLTMGTTHINACVLSTQVGRLSNVVEKALVDRTPGERVLFCLYSDERGRQLKGEHSRLWPWNSNPPMLSSSSRCFASLSPSSRLSRSSLAFSKPNHPIPFVYSVHCPIKDRVKTYLSSSAIRHRWVLLETS
ncbi:uncharacterized protein FOBCDRAFT_202960 [Fusarium oxysporum Fo47]|uniref:uncharacterized protein n=1 Tax=Fusarium oxysporum Fo47 TaxID=660027 RepID=UPI002869B30F|nr:uncharacterized protein FOBCDRAFT_202960 [Fusarium oxysporum Fo47]QKD55848.2 hypothetical protein FOBCDRAFT_202960 [Fusarium oxysporum Fo47]